MATKPSSSSSSSAGSPSSIALNLNDTDEFNIFFSNLNTLLLSATSKKHKAKIKIKKPNNLVFSSATLSSSVMKSTERSTRAKDSEIRSVMKSMPVVDRSLIGAIAGGMAGAFTYFCLLPIDAVKTKLQTRGASQIYSSAIDATIQTFKSDGILGFYRGVSAVVVGSAFSSSVYFGTCELGKSLLGKFPSFPTVLIPPTAGAMGNVVSSAIMVPKELVTQRMQAGVTGRSWEVVMKILEKDGILGLYAGYSATLLRNLPAGILSYSSFEYLKAFVLSESRQEFLRPLESVCCGAMAGAISASLTTPLDVVKTRLMTQIHGEIETKISLTVASILKEEGLLGFTRGIGPRILHSACFSALGYFAFETVRLALLRQYTPSVPVLVPVEEENIKDR